MAINIMAIKISDVGRAPFIYCLKLDKSLYYLYLCMKTTIRKIGNCVLLEHHGIVSKFRRIVYFDTAYGAGLNVFLMRFLYTRGNQTISVQRVADTLWIGFLALLLRMVRPQLDSNCPD